VGVWWAVLVAVLAWAAAPAGASSRSAADLLVAKVSEPPAALVGGEAFSVSVSVRNAGRRAAGRSSVGFFLTPGRRRGRGEVRLAGRRAIGRLKQGRRGAGRARVRVPRSVRAGRYRLVACADVLRRVRERSERNNCRASKRTVLVRPGGSQSGLAPPTPGSVQSPLPPGGPAPAAPAPAPGTGGGTSPPPPPPSGGGQPSSHALIEAALQAGEIDEETALLYTVYAEFGDDRLPERFRGAPLEVTDTDTLARVAERWGDLSAATREALDAFFIPPFNTASWHGRAGGGAGASGGAGARDSPITEPGRDLCENTAPNMQRWGFVTAVGGDVRVWYENTVGGQFDRALALAVALDGGIWSAVTGLYRTPLFDGGGNSVRRCRGFDPSIDIALVDLKGVDGFAIRYYDNPRACQGPTPGFLLVNRTLSGDKLKATAVHEIAHLTHFAYAGDYCADRDHSWLTEATATWTEDHVGDFGDDPRKFAPYFLDRPHLPLETYESPGKSGTPRQYGAYLFFQWLARTQGPDRVSNVWDATEYAGGNSLDNLQSILEATHEGGFREAWKEFALAGLNPRPEVDWFKRWDGLGFGAKVSWEQLSAPGEHSVPLELPHLAAAYHEFTFTDTVKQIEFENPLVGVPGASVQAWRRIEDGSSVRYEVDDWSDSEREVFCRERPGENVTDLVLVFANSTHADRDHVLTSAPEPLVRTQSGCGDYDGNSSVTLRYDGLTEVYRTEYSMAGTGGGTRDGMLESWFATPHDPGTAPRMRARWEISGTSTSNGCTYSGEATWPEGETGLQALLTTRQPVSGGATGEYEHSFQIPFKLVEVQRTCPEHSDTLFFGLGWSVDSGRKQWDPAGDGITGSKTEDHPGLTITSEWTLKRE
jgi:hypothetical protein